MIAGRQRDEFLQAMGRPVPKRRQDHRLGCLPEGSRSEGMTLTAVAEEMGLSRERVRQIEAAAIRKMRRHPLGPAILKLLQDERTT